MFNKWSGLDHPASVRRQKQAFSGFLFFYDDKVRVRKERDLYVETSGLSLFKINAIQSLKTLMLLGREARQKYGWVSLLRYINVKQRHPLIHNTQSGIKNKAWIFSLRVQSLPADVGDMG